MMQNKKIANLKLALHVSSKSSIESIIKNGLIPCIGPLSERMEELEGVYLFPTWASMMDANWFFDDWPHETEPVLFSVNLEGLDIESDVGYEVVCRSNIHPDRITLISDKEENWDLAKIKFLKLGGII